MTINKSIYKLSTPGRDLFEVMRKKVEVPLEASELAQLRDAKPAGCAKMLLEFIDKFHDGTGRISQELAYSKFPELSANHKGRVTGTLRHLGLIDSHGRYLRDRQFSLTQRVRDALRQLALDKLSE